MTDIAETEDADHPFALVDHRQPSDLQLLHVTNRLSKVVVLTTAMDFRSHHIARRRTAGIEGVLRQRSELHATRQRQYTCLSHD